MDGKQEAWTKGQNVAPGNYTAPKVMISSSFPDLVAHREKVDAALRAAGLFPESMEFDANRPGMDLIDSSLGMVARAAGYVLIIGHRYGNCPNCPERNPHGLSLTELEFDAAQARKLPTLVFVAAQDLGIDIDPSEFEKILAFKNKAIHPPGWAVARLIKQFDGQEDLATKVASACPHLKTDIETFLAGNFDPRPFQRVNSASNLFLGGGHGDLIPSWSDFEQEKVPSRAELVQVREALSEHGGVLLSGSQSTGKTTLVKLLAHGRALTTYTLDVPSAGEDDEEKLLSAITHALGQAGPNELFVIENAHGAPSPVVRAINFWLGLNRLDRPQLLVTQRDITSSAPAWEPTADVAKAGLPAHIALKQDEDALLSGIVARIWEKAQPSRTLPNFDGRARKSWKAMAGDLTALSLAVWEGANRLSWDGMVTPEAAKAYVKARYLDNLPTGSKELLVQIASLADAIELQLPESRVNMNDAKPLLESGVVHLFQPSNSRPRRYRIAHPSIARLILATELGPGEYYFAQRYIDSIAQTPWRVRNLALYGAEVVNRTEQGKRYVEILLSVCDEHVTDAERNAYRHYLTRRDRAAFQLGCKDAEPFLNDPALSANRDLIAAIFDPEAVLDEEFAKRIADRFEQDKSRLAMADDDQHEVSAALDHGYVLEQSRKRIECLLETLGFLETSKFMSKLRSYAGLTKLYGHWAHLAGQSELAHHFVRTVEDFCALARSVPEGELPPDEELTKLFDKAGFFLPDRPPNWVPEFIGHLRKRADLLGVRRAADAIVRKFDAANLLKWRTKLELRVWQSIVSWLRIPEACGLNYEEAFAFTKSIFDLPWFADPRGGLLSQLSEKMREPTGRNKPWRILPFGNLPDFTFQMGQIADERIRNMLAEQSAGFLRDRLSKLPRDDWTADSMFHQKYLCLFAGTTLLGVTTRLPGWLKLAQEDWDRTLIDIANSRHSDASVLNADEAGVLGAAYEISRLKNTAFRLKTRIHQDLLARSAVSPFPPGQRIIAYISVICDWLHTGTLDGESVVLSIPETLLEEATSTLQRNLPPIEFGEHATMS